MSRAHTSIKAKFPSSLSLIALSVIGVNGMMMSSYATAETIVLDSLIITGEKINKTIKDTSTAVTVISQEQLASGETKNSKMVATEAPNVITTGFGNISIRGISGNGPATGGYALVTGARTRVSTVIDGSPQDWSGYNFTPSGVWDAQQVEVLRGPQSTTQGTSSIGGAVVIKTNDPTFTDEASIRAGLETYKNGNIKYNMAAMSSGALTDDELAYRIAIDGSKGEGWMNYKEVDTEFDGIPNISDAENINLRGKLLWTPSEQPNLTALITVEHHKYDGEYLSWANDEETNYSRQTMTLNDEEGDNIRLQNSSVNAISADIDYQINTGITNSLHIGYSDSDIHFEQYPNAFAVDIDKETVFFENRLLFNQENTNFSGVLGLYAAKKDAYTYASYLRSDDVTTTTAIYGESAYSFSDTTNLIAGIRVENEKVDRTSGFDWTGQIDQNNDKTYLLPKLGITQDISNNTTLGATVRKGYSPSGSGFEWGGNYNFYTYDSEEVLAYELSSKSHFDNGSTMNVSLFFNDYSDYQAFIDSTYIDNIDSAHTYGAELEATTWLTQNLEIRGSAGLLHSKIDNFDSFKGNKLPSAPEKNIGLGFTQYVGDQWSFGADITYVGEYYSDLKNTEEYQAGDYITADARIQYVNNSLTVDGYITNLTDEDVVYYATRGSRASIGQTRTVGISATYRM